MAKSNRCGYQAIAARSRNNITPHPRIKNRFGYQIGIFSITHATHRDRLGGLLSADATRRVIMK